MIPWNSIAPSVENLIPLDNIGSTQAQDPFGNISEFHIWWNGRNLHHTCHVVPPPFQTQSRGADVCGTFLCKIFVLLIKAAKTCRFVSLKLVPINQSLVRVDVGVFVQECL